MFGNNFKQGAHFLNLHIDKARKTHVDKQLYLITHFTNLNSRSMVATSSFGSLYFAVHFPTKSNSYKKFPALWPYQFTIYQCINRLNAHLSRNCAGHTIFLFFTNFRRSKSALCHLICEATCSLRTYKQLGNNVTFMNIQKLSQSSNSVIPHFLRIMHISSLKQNILVDCD